MATAIIQLCSAFTTDSHRTSDDELESFEYISFKDFSCFFFIEEVLVYMKKESKFTDFFFIILILQDKNWALFRVYIGYQCAT